MTKYKYFFSWKSDLTIKNNIGREWKKKLLEKTIWKHFIGIIQKMKKIIQSSIYMHLTLSYSEFQPVGHWYLNYLLSCSGFITPDLGYSWFGLLLTWVTPDLGYSWLGLLLTLVSPDLGLPTEVQRAEHLPIAELFNLERAEIFFKILAALIVKTTV